MKYFIDIKTATFPKLLFNVTEIQSIAITSDKNVDTKFTDVNNNVIKIGMKVKGLTEFSGISTVFREHDSIQPFNYLLLNNKQKLTDFIIVDDIAEYDLFEINKNINVTDLLVDSIEYATSLYNYLLNKDNETNLNDYSNKTVDVDKFKMLIKKYGKSHTKIVNKLNQYIQTNISVTLSQMYEFEGHGKITTDNTTNIIVTNDKSNLIKYTKHLKYVDLIKEIKMTDSVNNFKNVKETKSSYS